VGRVALLWAQILDLVIYAIPFRRLAVNSPSRACVLKYSPFLSDSYQQASNVISAADGETRSHGGRLFL